MSQFPAVRRGDPEIARVLSLNVGQPAIIGSRRGRPVRSAIAKAPTPERLRVRGVNVEGDDQADRSVHGGPDKAVYAYAVEDLAWWAGQLDRELPPGSFGENLTVAGMSCTDAVVGERWRIGSAVLEVAQPRLPCFKLALHLDEPRMTKRFARATRPGAYLRVVQEGELGAGDAIERLRRPEHGVTVGLVSDAVLNDPTLRTRAGSAPELAGGLAQWLAQRAAAERARP